MSIYATLLRMGEHGDLPAPLAYLGSGELLDPDSCERRGWLGVAQVPNHVRAYREVGPCEEVDEHDPTHTTEVLRLSVHDGSEQAVVVLDREQVSALADTLSAWLAEDVHY